MYNTCPNPGRTQMKYSHHSLINNKLSRLTGAWIWRWTAMSNSYAAKPDAAHPLISICAVGLEVLVPDRCESGDATVNHCSWLVSVNCWGCRWDYFCRHTKGPLLFVDFGGAADSILAFWAWSFVPKTCGSLGGQTKIIFRVGKAFSIWSLRPLLPVIPAE